MRGILRRVGEALPWVLVVVLLALLGRTWAARLPYPYDLEWMEGGMLAHAWRLSRGEPLYLPPNPDFVPYIYPPGYSSLVAFFSLPVGVGPLPARLLTLLAVFAAAAAIVYILRLRRVAWGVAVASGATFIGTYRAAGAFYDLARPDGMYVALLGWSVALALTPGRGTAVASGLLLAASFFMKHNAAIFGFPLAFALLLRNGRDGVAFVAASALPALALVGLFQWRSSGVFLTYLVDVPQSHPSAWWRFYPGTPLELGNALPVACASIGVLAVWHQARLGTWSRPLSAIVPVAVGVVAGWWATRAGFPIPEIRHFAGGPGVFVVGVLAVVAAMRLAETRRRALAYDQVLLGAIVVTALLLAGRMRAHNGGYVNVHTHMFWVFSLLFGWMLGHTPKWLAGVLVASQLTWAAATTHGRQLRPTAADRNAGDRMVEALRDKEGPVLAPFAAWLPTYAGHPPSLHYMGVWDLDYKGGPMVDELDVLRRAVREHHWPTALDADQPFPYGLREHYREQGKPLVSDGPALRPKTGWGARPQQLMVPR